MSSVLSESGGSGDHFLSSLSTASPACVTSPNRDTYAGAGEGDSCLAVEPGLASGEPEEANFTLEQGEVILPARLGPSKSAPAQPPSPGEAGVLGRRREGSVSSRTGRGRGSHGAVPAQDAGLRRKQAKKPVPEVLPRPPGLVLLDPPEPCAESLHQHRRWKILQGLEEGRRGSRSQALGARHWGPGCSRGFVQQPWCARGVGARRRAPSVTSGRCWKAWEALTWDGVAGRRGWRPVGWALSSVQTSGLLPHAWHRDVTSTLASAREEE